MNTDNGSPMQAKSELEDVIDDSDWEDGSNPNLNSENNHQNHINNNISIEFDASPGSNSNTAKKKPVRRASTEEKKFKYFRRDCCFICCIVQIIESFNMICAILNVASLKPDADKSDDTSPGKKIWYCSKWYKISSHRVNPAWWDSVLFPLKALESKGTNNSLEDTELETKALTEPLPTNQQKSSFICS
ncbi:hypothetical protein L2E82_08162 [Cichorium intybus]|uniref:Uncharacterized protein n=1 Tax=Cichorium intybus TaxID=13427 RepID=A0ACB9G5Q5_CICIN|nr:hypothetical protein L2E82_08162 [Cichorium intybus]